MNKYVLYSIIFRICCPHVLSRRLTRFLSLQDSLVDGFRVLQESPARLDHLDKEREIEIERDPHEYFFHLRATASP